MFSPYPLAKERFILVTGAPRSGTTFVGKMLAAPANVGYLKEPFNANFGAEGLSGQFIYLNGVDNRPADRELVDNFLRGKSQFKRLPTNQNDSTMVRLGRKAFRSGSHFSFEAARWLPWINTYLFKDPMACLMAQYLHRQYDFQVVILIRHPAAMVGSFKRLGMYHSLEQLIAQDRLMEEHLKGLIPPDWQRLSSVEQIALLWRCLNQVLHQFSQANPRMIVMRHEDISASPELSFRSLYDQLGLHYSYGVGRTIRNHTAARNPVDPTNNRMHQLKRDSRSNIYRWRKVLTLDELRAIKAITGDMADRYYDEATWGLEPELEPSELLIAS